MEGNDMDPTDQSLMSDDELVTLTREGDSEAYGVLWTRHYAEAMSYARSISREDAEDIVGDAFASILKAIKGGGGPKENFRAYVYSSVRNMAFKRRQRLHGEIVGLVDASADEVGVSVEGEVFSNLDEERINRVFYAMEPRQREVLWLTEVEEMPLKGVGEKLGITAGNAGIIAHRARHSFVKLWIQSYVKDADATGEHKWVLDHVGEYLSGHATDAVKKRMSEHLDECADCVAAVEEVDTVWRQLRTRIVPAVIGVPLAMFAAAPGAEAAEIVGPVAMPDSLTAMMGENPGAGAQSGSGQSDSGQSGQSDSGQGQSGTDQSGTGKSGAKGKPGSRTSLYRGIGLAAAALAFVVLLGISTQPGAGEPEENAPVAMVPAPGKVVATPWASSTPERAPASSPSPIPTPAVTGAPKAAPAVPEKPGVAVKPAPVKRTSAPAATPAPAKKPAIVIRAVDAGPADVCYAVLSGTARPGSRVSVNNGREGVLTVAVNGSGHWTAGPLDGLAAGSVSVGAYDKSGAQTADSAVVRLAKPPTLSATVVGEKLSVLVNGVPGMSADLYIGGRLVDTVSLDGSGRGQGTYGFSPSSDGKVTIGVGYRAAGCESPVATMVGRFG